MKITRRELLPGERIRVLVVDDSVVVRRMIARALSQHELIDVVGTAASGSIALLRMAQFNPDVVILDIEMPGIDGLEVLRQIRRDYPATRVVMFSTLTERGAAVTFEALASGADDYATKASTTGRHEDPALGVRQTLTPKITQFFRLPENDADLEISAISPSPGKNIPAPRTILGGSQTLPAKAIVIGVSTGGPNALAEILPAFPKDFRLPILVVQHMPPLFTRFLAERLDRLCALGAEEAVGGTILSEGKILIAPGDFHMRVVRQSERVVVALDQSPPQNSCRPAVDVLFKSAAEVYGGSVIAVVLTGMGQDGLRGAEILKSQGASVLVQDEATSVVWGMPGAVANSGLADKILPLDEVVPEILRNVGRA